MELKAFLCVAVGGAVGSCLRYAISLVPFKEGFPFATLAANLIGALLIGFIAGFAAEKSVNKNLVLMLKTGLCGGFTTFSTFSLETFGMLKDGRTALGIVYALVSVAGCVLGIWLGMTLGTSAAKA